MTEQEAEFDQGCAQHFQVPSSQSLMVMMVHAVVITEIKL